MKTNQVDRLMTLTKKYAHDDEFQEYLALFSLWCELRGVDDKFRFMTIEHSTETLKESEGKE